MKNKIQRAIIMAAGLGTRLKPLTDTIPKPLIAINGQRMIESIIEALHYNSVYEIFVVVGYEKEQFLYLEEKYDGLRLIENPFYRQYNNISSLFVARDYIANALILDGDQIIYNKDILFTDFECSGYSAVRTDQPTDEWLLQVDENDIITECSRTGGNHGWQLYSISRWTQEDGQRLKELLEYEFLEKKNTSIYWDDVAMFAHFEKFKLQIYRMQSSDIIEIDSLRELISLDNNYHYLGE